MNIILEKLTEVIDKNRIFQNEPLKKHTTFRIGGSADFFVSVKNAEEIRKIKDICAKESVPMSVIGNGSNLLVSDQGYRGVVVQIGKDMSEIQIQGEMVCAQAGALLSKIGSRVLEAGLTGFEFAAGIPGTIGGGIVMNAGAYGGELKDVVQSVTVLNKEMRLQELSLEELQLGYRTSIILKEGYIVVGVKLRLQQGEKELIKARMEELREQRITKQPLEYPSAGSTFKRPEGYFAGKLIQDAGLRGYTVGGAQVSEKHCGFVINKGNATAQDIVDLMENVEKIVFEKFGVHLEPEVKRLGEF